MIEKDIRAFYGLFLEYECPAQTFDVISMNHCLERNLDSKAELTKARDLLKQDGCLIGKLPGFDSYERRLFKGYWGGNHVPRHTFQFPQDFLHNLLKNAATATFKSRMN